MDKDNRVTVKVDGYGIFADKLREEIDKIADAMYGKEYKMETGTLKELNVKPRASVSPDHAWEADTPKLWRDMTDSEKGALLLAHHEGKVIERHCRDGWRAVLHTFWHDDVAYRVKR